jgi:hypothetical protein
MAVEQSPEVAFSRIGRPAKHQRQNLIFPQLQQAMTRMPEA